MKSQTKGAATRKRTWQLWHRVAVAMSSLGLTRRLHERDTIPEHSAENHEYSTENHDPKENTQ